MADDSGSWAQAPQSPAIMVPSTRDADVTALVPRSEGSSGEAPGIADESYVVRVRFAESRCSLQVQQLSSSKPRDRWKAADELAKLGKEAGAASADLLRCLDDDDPDVRCAAARAVGHVCDDTAVEVLSQLLEDPENGRKECSGCSDASVEASSKTS